MCDKACRRNDLTGSTSFPYGINNYSLLHSRMLQSISSLFVFVRTLIRMQRTGVVVLSEYWLHIEIPWFCVIIRHGAVYGATDVGGPLLCSMCIRYSIPIRIYECQTEWNAWRRHSISPYLHSTDTGVHIFQWVSAMHSFRTWYQNRRIQLVRNIENLHLLWW